jgi:glycosyltransferase involved in cell wall biosynthesis
MRPGDALVTIAIPTLDRPGMLREALESALAQGWGAVEVLVSDNASGPETARVIASLAGPKVRAFRQERRLGMVEHWNFLLSQARGEWLLLLSDDDLLDPGAVEALLEPFAAPGVVMCYCPYRIIDEQGRLLGQSRPGPPRASGGEFIEAHLRYQARVMPSGTLLRTSAIRELGGFPATGTTSDFALRLAVATRGDVACLEAPVMSYRTHSTNLSSGFAAVIAAHFDCYAWCAAREALAPWLPALAGYVLRVTETWALQSVRGDDPKGVAAFLAGLERLPAAAWRKRLSRAIIANGRRWWMRLARRR